MSRHQAVRNLDYQEALDEADGYSDDEEELSVEDKAHMQQGVIDVKTALGSEASKVTTAQIEEALWHYYYDVDKSVAYLIGKFVAPANKAAKPLKQSSGVRLSSPNISASFWDDMPWGQTSLERQAVFIQPAAPLGGLLGGSGEVKKSSKLSQLAAARKRKHEEKKSQANVEQARENLAELSVVDPNIPTIVTQDAYGKRIKTTEPKTDSVSWSTADLQNPRQPTKMLSENSPGDVLMADVQPRTVNDDLPATRPAAPSAFAQALFGTPGTNAQPIPETFPLPYMAFSPPLEAFSAPSPDDVVLSAQAKVSTAGKIAALPPKKVATGAQGISDEVKALKIEDVRPKSKNLDVLSEFVKSQRKKNASFVVVGHVDAGKSTMMGRLLLDLNVVEQRTVDRLRREAEKIGKSSFALAWVLDQRTEERNRGVTIDIATNRFETDTTAFTILDAPGHRDFIPNMIAGASQADFAILVVDAGTGAFESGLKGQTKEHSLLIRSMGVSRIIVAINKLDTVQWSQERFTEIKDQITGFLTAKTMGFHAKNVVFVPVSGLHGDNLVRRSTDPAASWYTGPTLLEELENSEPSARALAKPLRMTIAEVFRTPQNPLSISGRIDAGSLQTGDDILTQPSGEKAFIKGLLVDDQPADWAVAGQNVVIHLSNIDPVHVRVGDIICDTKKPIDCRDTFTLKALAFEFLMPMQVDVHRGRLHVEGRIEEISALLDKVTGLVTKKRPKIAKPGNTVRISIKMNTNVPLEAGQRIILRNGGETIAAGLLE